MRRIPLCWSWLLVGALLTPAVRAEDTGPAMVQVWSIRATTKHEKVSPELRELAKVLKKQFKYTGFTLEGRSTGRAELGKEYAASLPERYRVEVTPKQRTGERITLQVLVSRKEGKEYKKRVETTVTVRQNAFVPIGCGPLGGGDQLIIAVRAR
jgi:hypothetical protein